MDGPALLMYVDLIILCLSDVVCTSMMDAELKANLYFSSFVDLL